MSDPARPGCKWLHSAGRCIGRRKSVAACSTCSEEYQPMTPTWPEGVCGECIAARIQLLLLRSVMDDERKPMRRAVREQDIDVTVEEVKRQA
jgi:hypothetical protein